jgi:hypothetical protein
MMESWDPRFRVKARRFESSKVYDFTIATRRASTPRGHQVLLGTRKVHRAWCAATEAKKRNYILDKCKT